MISFKDQVVIVTGAGGGLGKDYALQFAKRGAKLVVNDLFAADAVVEEIRSAGGIAVADSHDVVKGEQIVETALSNFGRVDVIVNNAGILRDVSFANMTEQQFRQVLEVHLYGTYHVCKAAWPLFKKQRYGRIVNVSSPSGLYGNFGQGNYSAAKMALVGLTETLAKEGYKYNILVNVIAPTAKSKMTDGIMPAEVLKKLGPEYITPMVMYLGSKNLKQQDTGKILELAGGFYGQTRWERSSGELFYPDETFTAESLLYKMKSICDFSSNKSFKPLENPTAPADYMHLVHEARKLSSPNPQGSEKVSLAGKVVLITGAGAGLGRAHAHVLAKYGAKVVVNDIVDPHTVVGEIRAAGGEAHADKHNAATDADAILANVIEKYGQIDGIINNAGILRDKSFQNMTYKQWSDVLEVHLIGTFKLCKAVWPIFRKQKHGNIVNITSTSGIYGSFGQANYSAAKMGILGLSQTLAKEGAKYNIKVNIVAPHAETAMTKTIFKKEDYNLYPPELVSPLLVLLSSDKVPTQGQLFEIGGGWCGATRLVTSAGAVSVDDASPEFVESHWSEIVGFKDQWYSTSLGDTLKYILQRIARASGSAADDDDDDDEEEEEAVEKDSKGNPVFKYTARDVILYNIGLGAKAKDLKYVYENSLDFQVIPSFGALMFQNVKPPKDLEVSLMDNFSPVMLLHGEEYVKIKQWPIPTSCKVAVKIEPVAIIDKGKNALLITGDDIYDVDTGKPLFYCEATIFNRGATSKNGTQFFKKRAPFAAQSFKPPQRKPDYVKEVATFEDQASIYRLSGDYNPLHIDPEFAANAKFKRPILHGLGYFGVSIKALSEDFGPIEEMKVRFSGSVYPGDRLRISGWKEGAVIVFEVFDIDSGKTVISNAAVKLRGSSRL